MREQEQPWRSQALEEGDMEMEALLDKYAGGRTPPLVAPDKEPPESGLLNGQLVGIYQRGFSGRYLIPLGILVAEPSCGFPEEKWSRANYSLNEHARRTWTSFCTAIRQSPSGEKTCELCDRSFAVESENKGAVIAYLCKHGMIDFAVPVSVGGIVIAVLFTGQRKPKPGTRWTAEFLEEGGLYRELGEAEPGHEAWPVCVSKIQETEARLGFRPGELVELLEADAKSGLHLEVSPQDVQCIMQQLESAGGHLSQLATTTVQLEKAKVVAWIRAKVGESLRGLTAEPPSFHEFSGALSRSLGLATRYFGCDCGAVILCQKAPPGLRVLARSSADPAAVGTAELVGMSREGIGRLIDALPTDHQTDHVAPGVLAPVLYSVAALASVRQTLVYRVSVPARSSIASACLIALSWPWEQSAVARLLAFDTEALREVLGAISTVTEVSLLVQELQLAAKKQAAFVLDVAHDIRNPIQNIVFKAARLASISLRSEDVAYHAKRIAAQVKRLHVLSERVWMLEQIDREDFKLDLTTRLKVFDVVSECRDLLAESASSNQVTVAIDQELQRWPALRLDRQLFMQAILNLLDNAIKYSSERTEVRVDGRDSPDERQISVVNRGLPIMPEECDEIFTKFYRTPAAQQWVTEGAGIGLYVVKKFADAYGAVSVKSCPVRGSRDYVTEFILKVRKEGTEYV